MLLKYEDKVVPALIMKDWGYTYIHLFLTSALDEGESSLCGPHVVTLQEELSVPTE
jgi:hypothetical protein